jgi:hypothetical protein
MTGVLVYIDATWMQKGLDALNDTFCVDAQTQREMIQFLFDEGFWDKGKLSWSAAEQRFNDCLNVRRPQFFKIAEVWALMSEPGATGCRARTSTAAPRDCGRRWLLQPWRRGLLTCRPPPKCWRH